MITALHFFLYRLTISKKKWSTQIPTGDSQLVALFGSVSNINLRNGNAPKKICARLINMQVANSPCSYPYFLHCKNLNFH